MSPPGFLKPWPPPPPRPAEGWHRYADEMPPRGALCVFRYPAAPAARPWVGYKHELISMNTSDLYWALTGIAREQMEQSTRATAQRGGNNA